MTKRITFGVDEFGNRLGEAHHRAKLSDADVERIRDMYETGMVSYKALAKQFGVSKTLIKKICDFEIRATTPAAYKTVKEHELKRPLPTPLTFDDRYSTPEENPISGLEALGEVLGLDANHALRVAKEYD